MENNSNRFATSMIAIALIVGVVAIMLYVFFGDVVNISQSPDILPTSEIDVNVQTTLPEDHEAINLQIQSIGFNQNISSVSDISFTIRNISDTLQDGLALFIISDKDADAPWENALYTSEELHFDHLAPQGIFTASFPDNLEEFEADEYRISFWVQTRDGDTSTHADGFTYWEPIWLGEGIVLTIDSASLTETSDENTYTAEIVLAVHNRSNETQSIALSYTISKPDNETPWVDGAYIAPFEFFELEADEQQIASYAVDIELEAGEYVVTGYLHLVEGDEQTEIDRVQFATILTIP